VRRFSLVRDGEVVADGEYRDEVWDLELPTIGPADRRGVMLGPGWAVMRWRGPHQSIVFWPSIADAVAVHGHAGTEFLWED
jgi:hypothetical protein